MPDISRRGFLAGVGAVASAPLMPKIKVAKAAATFTKTQFVWATAYAQMNNACSPAQIMQSLAVPANVAQKIYAEMIRKGVLYVPAGGGTAQAARPTYRGINGHRPAIRQTVARTRRGPARLDAARIMAVVTRDMHWQIPFRPERAGISPFDSPRHRHVIA